MKSGGGKNKGSSFERKVCRILTKWITGKEHPEIFWRSASSGAKSTMDSIKGTATDMHGDIMAVNEEGFWFTSKFLIECKFYKDVDIGKFLTGSGKLRDWWNQACEDGAKANKIPLLIFKRNGSPIYIMFNSFDCRFFEVCFSESKKWRIEIRDNCAIYPYQIYLLEDFLDWIDIESLKYKREE